MQFYDMGLGDQISLILYAFPFYLAWTFLWPFLGSFFIQKPSLTHTYTGSPSQRHKQRRDAIAVEYPGAVIHASAHAYATPRA
jgi:hypothetical protein